MGRDNTKTLMITFIILFIIALIGCGVLGYFFYVRQTEYDNLSLEYENYKIEEEELKKTLTGKEVIKEIDKYIMPSINTQKFSELGNDKFEMDANSNSTSTITGINGRIDVNGNAYIAVYDKNYCPKVAKIGEYVKVTGFNKKVKQICINNFTTAYLPIVVFLMEDGTIEQMNMQVFKDDAKCETAGKVGDYVNIVKLENIIVNAGADIYSANFVGGYGKNIVAIKSDGTSSYVKNLVMAEKGN